MSSTEEVHAALRTWAKGILTLEAAVEALIAADRGRWVDPGQPWVRRAEPDGWWLDFDLMANELGPLSGGERRYLSLIASIASDDVNVPLGEAVTGLDHVHLRLVLDAIAHAGGVYAR